MAIRTGADTVVRAVPTRRQQLRGAIDNGLLRPGPDDTYADGDDSTWIEVDWPSMTRRVTVEGREVNVVDTGGDAGRPAMVFVHGLGGAWQNWLLNIPAFMGSHRVIAPDLPGFGESPMPREEISIKGYARILDGLLGQLGVESAVVVGNSMGGFVAAELALSFATRVERLVLVSAAGLSIEDYAPRAAAGRRARVGRHRDVGSARAAARSSRGRGCAGSGCSCSCATRRSSRPQLTFELARGAGTPGFVPAMKALLSYGFRDQLSRIEVPTLVVWGRNDMLVPRGDAREYVRLIGDNARREMFEDTGHLSMVERPTRFNRLLEAFASGGRTSPRPASRASAPEGAEASGQ